MYAFISRPPKIIILSNPTFNPTLAMPKLAPFHVLLFSLAYGTNVFHSYINAPLLFKNLKREDFSHVTNLILPKYFVAQALAPIGLYLTSPLLGSAVLRKQSLILLGVTSAFNLVNYGLILPKVQSLKKKKLALEARLGGADDDHIKAELKSLGKQFGKYHGLSLLCNVVTTVSLTWYGVVMSNGLVAL